tara:strand:+ start:198 stop:572 length:375 start_codon:yes stop_codon:yes gene_type:complete
MSQDIIADTLNQMMNAKRSGKSTIVIKRNSKALLSVLALAKLKGYVKDYKLDEGELTIDIGPIQGCKAIKPRYTVMVEDLDKYVQRYLPAKDIGLLIVSTNQGIMTHTTAQEKNLGGCLIAYLY